MRLDNMKSGKRRAAPVNMDALINVMASITLFVMMMTVGIGVNFGDVLKVAANWRLSLRAAIANYLFVPLFAVGLLLYFHPRPMVAVGFLVAVICPGAPFGPPLTAIAKGRVVTAVGLMAVLAGSSAIIAPLLLRFLLPAIGVPSDLMLNPLNVIKVLMLSQFLPLCLGLWLRRSQPAWTGRWKNVFTRVSTLLNVWLLVLILVVQFNMLRQIRLRGYLGMLALVLATIIVGWVMGGPHRDERKTMAIITSTRNVGVALVIVAGTFPGTPAITATIAFALFQIVLVLLIAAAWGRVSSTALGASKAAD